MSDKDWQRFFDLLEKIVDMPNKTFSEKKGAVEQAATEYGEMAETNLEEFVSWWK